MPTSTTIRHVPLGINPIIISQLKTVKHRHSLYKTKSSYKKPINFHITVGYINIFINLTIFSAHYEFPEKFQVPILVDYLNRHRKLKTQCSQYP